MNKTPTDGTEVQTVPQLLAHALAMETEASERYGELADQMEMHRKTAVATLFRRLEVAEKQHLADLTALCKGVELPHYAPWDFKWRSKECPETIDLGRVHYQLSVRDAVLLALEHERRATQFYTDVANSAHAPEVIALARQFAQEEREHSAWLESCLAECSAADSKASEDPDPPLSQE
ncbi:MAG: rubrerythrin [Comamonadaceae bacterium CG12_big_fil_rev_8_21_14_0_65_59_15]|nr:MAG: rubrerythrin [Comamonadaceae bacterium CG12_big_fil_rev_8_21_14_0_65_59_15]